jgi:hypothetical protein
VSNVPKVLKIILDAPMDLLGDIGLVDSHFHPF